MFVLFLVEHLAVFALVILTAAGAGTLAAGPREGLALRSALGLALMAHALFGLGLIGQLRPGPLLALTLVAIVGGALRARRQWPPARLSFACVLTAAPLFFLALFPPLAFDETLYHLPLVDEVAREGALRFFGDLRFPVFPLLHELLCLPVFLLAGDAATHLVTVAEVLITVALLFDWGRRYGGRAGWLAAAIFLGSPLVIHSATILYVDAALTLFVAAGFHALDRERYGLAGLFFGSACGVKYLGGYFAIVALLIVIVRAVNRRRSVAVFIGACAATALPTTAWILFHTGNPVFPFFGNNLWRLNAREPISLLERVIGGIRVIWDVTFARERIGLQPPMTPLLVAIVVLVVLGAVRDARARWIALVSLVYLAAFSFLPQDSRYLMPLLPLLSIAAAVIVASRRPRAVVLLALVALAPGMAYAGYRMALLGVPPVSTAAREDWLSRRVPEYRALLRAGSDPIYVCGAEQLKSHAGGRLLGDHAGPYSYGRILPAAGGTMEIAQRLESIGARYFLLSRRVCDPPFVNGGMDLVHEDAHAQLWRVQR